MTEYFGRPDTYDSADFYKNRQERDPYNPYRNFHGFDAQVTHQMGQGEAVAAQARNRYHAANADMQAQAQNAQQAALGMAQTRGFSPNAVRAAGNANTQMTQQVNIASRQNQLAAAEAASQLELQAWNERMQAINDMREAHGARYGVQTEAESAREDLKNKRRLFDRGADYDEVMGITKAVVGGAGSAFSAAGEV